MPTSATEPVTLYTVRQVADMWQLRSTNRIDRAVAAGRIPHRRAGRLIRFTAEDIAAAYRILFEPQGPARPVPKPRGARGVSDVDLSGVAVSARSRRRHVSTPG